MQENSYHYKINSKYYKVGQMMDLYDTLGYNKDLSKKSDYKETFTEEEKKDIMKQYKGVSKSIDLNDEYKRFQLLIKITKNLFGKEIVSSQKKQIKGKRQQVYSINKRIISNLYEIQEHQKRHKVIKPNTKEYTEYYFKHRFNETINIKKSCCEALFVCNCVENVYENKN